MKTLIVLLFCSVFCIGQDNSSFIHYLHENKWSDAYQMTSADFQKKVSEDQLENVWGFLSNKKGGIESIEDICVDTTKQSIDSYFQMNYKKGVGKMKVVHDLDGKVIGFFNTSSAPCSPEEYKLPNYIDRGMLNEDTLTIDHPEYRIYGSLVKAKGESKNKLLVFVHGSGPNDRDETIGPNKLFLEMAYFLANQGISSYRFDKRTLSHKIEGEATIKTEVLDEVNHVINYFSEDKQFEGYDIYLVSHSLGGMVTPTLLQNNPKIKGAIMLAGSPTKLDEIIEYQMNYLFNLDGEITLEEKSQLDTLTSQLELLRSDWGQSAKPSDLPMGVPYEYWKSLWGIEPLKVFGEVQQPMLILQGERDYQIPMKDFEKWKSANKSNATFKSYKKLNHIFTEGKGKGNPDEYFEKKSVPKYVLEDMAEWLFQN